MKNLVTKARAGFYGLAASALSVGIAAPAHAQLQEQLTGQLNQTTTAAYGSQPSTSLPEMVGRIINVALSLLGVLLVVLVIYAGFLWMTAQGNEDKVKTAKKILTNAVIGMVLIFAAYAITNFVIERLVGATVG
jgi:hypothetical protein